MRKTLLTAASFLLAWGASTQTILFSEDFEGTTPLASWTQTTNATDGGWNSGTEAALSSQYWTISGNGTNIAASNDDDCNCDKSNDLLQSPSINLTGVSAATLSVDVFFNGGSYQGATEEGYIEISTNGGSTWTVLETLAGAAGWETYLVDLTPYAGNNVVLGFRYRDDAGWVFGYAIDNVTVTEPAALDLAVTDVDMLAIYGLNNTPIDVAGTITNYGSTTITSFTLNYEINNGTAVTQNVTGVSIAPLGTYNFTHATQWNPTITGNYTVDVYATNLNGSNDANTSNDVGSATIEVVTATAERTVLYEYFTSSTCGPCAAVAPATKTLLTNNNANTTGRIGVVKYQWDFPSPGNDPCFNAQVDARFTYYGVNGIPNAIVDGTYFNDHPVNMSQGIFDDRLDMPSLVELDANANYNGGLIEVSVDVNPLADINTSNLRLHIAITEDQLTHNLITTSENEFYYVTRTLLPNQNGTTVGPLVAGTPVNVTQSKTMTINTAPVQGANNTLVGDMTGVTAVVWLQNNTTREVLQAAYVKPTFLSTEDLEANELAMDLFPNPSNDFAKVVLNVEGNSDVIVEVLDMSGKIVLNVNENLGAGTQFVLINTADMPSGLYMVRVTNGNKIGTKMLSVSH